MEYAGSQLHASNVYGKGIDEIVMRTDPAVNSGQPFYYQQDHEGSVTHLTSGAGAVIESYRYDVFGAPTTLTSSGNFNNRFKFTGREYSSTFAFYEYRARAYHPGLGRFTSEDPKGFDAGDYNLFRYCHNDPIDLTDPMGLEVESQHNSRKTHDRGASRDVRDRALAALKARAHAKSWFPGGGGPEYAQLSLALESQAQSSQAEGGAQFRYSHPEHDDKPHRTNDKNGGGATFRWQLNEYYPDSKKLKPVKQYGWGNKEIEVSRTGNIGTVKTTPQGIMALSSKAILSDHVAPFVQDPGGTVHGTVTLRNEIYERVGNAWQYRGSAGQFTHTYDRGADGAWQVDSQISSP